MWNDHLQADDVAESFNVVPKIDLKLNTRVSFRKAKNFN